MGKGAALEDIYPRRAAGNSTAGAGRKGPVSYTHLVGIAPLLCKAFEIPFLVQNGVRVARNVIVTGQALIERGKFFLPSVWLPYQALLSD